MRSKVFLLAFSLAILAAGCDSALFSQDSATVKIGAEVLLDDYLNDLDDLRVGLVMNPTARIEDSHMLDTLLARDVNITALFAPEHGFRGDQGAGEKIEDGIDQATGLPVFSLYGENRKPTEQMLSKVDVLLFDMQDVGARFYTYNATLGKIIEAAAPAGVPVWVLDRPNPAGGNFISGWMLQEKHKSFVGAYPIPMAHGMTLGELADMMVGEGWIENAEEADVRVIPMKGWKRSMKWPDTNLKWIPPSPNLPSFRHAFIYLGTVLFEAVDISEGRGTSNPFLKIGAPTTKLTSSHIARLRRKFSGVNIERISFRPESMPGKAANPAFEDEQCHGVEIQVTDLSRIEPLRLGVELLATMLDATPDAELNDYIEKLSGIDKSVFVNQLQDRTYLDNWESTAKTFAEKREDYLLYD